MVKHTAQKQGVSEMRKLKKSTKAKTFTETNRHIIPPHLDEDIDDDLAFNSEDEELYGHFFNKVNHASNIDHSMEVIDERESDNAIYDYHNDDDGLEELANSVSTKNKKMHNNDKHRSSKALSNNNNTSEKSSNDDSKVQYLDLSDMLDISLQREKKEQQKGKQSRKESSNVAKSKETGVTKKRRSARVTEAAESLYESINEVKSTHNKENRKLSEQFHTSLSKLVEESKAKQANGGVEQRLERTLYNNQNLLSVDEDDLTKTRITRQEVREVVNEDLQKFSPTLRELSNSKHIRFPLSASESNPVPSSLGGIVSATLLNSSSDNNNNSNNNNNTNILYSGSGGSGANNKTIPYLQTSESASRLTNRIASLLHRAGLSSKNAEESAYNSRTAAPDTAAKDTSDFVSFASTRSNTNNSHNIEHKGKSDNKSISTFTETTDAPSTGYLIKLKSMLASENSRRKRFNKIKSKTYRRILRKEKEHERERRQRAFELLHPETARRRLAEKLSHARAHERVTQKHKNTSMWVRRVKRFGDKDADTKDALNEQLHLHQILMQKAEEEAGTQLRTSNEPTPSLVNNFSVNSNEKAQGYDKNNLAPNDFSTMNKEGNTKYLESYKKNETRPCHSVYDSNENEYNTDNIDDMVDEQAVDELLYEALPSESNVNDSIINKTNNEVSYWKRNNCESRKEEELEHVEVDLESRHSNEENKDVLDNSQRVSALDDLLQMKFMKVARERQEKEYEEYMQELKREVAVYCKKNGISRDALLNLNNTKEQQQWQRYKQQREEELEREEYNVGISDIDGNDEKSTRSSSRMISNSTYSNEPDNTTQKEEELQVNITNTNNLNCPSLLAKNGHRKFASDHHSLEYEFEGSDMHQLSSSTPIISNEINDKMNVEQKRNKYEKMANLEVILHKQKGIEIINDNLESNGSVVRKQGGTGKKKAIRPLEKMLEAGIHAQGITVTNYEKENETQDESSRKIFAEQKNDQTSQKNILEEQSKEVFAPHRNTGIEKLPGTTSYISLTAKALMAAKKKKHQANENVENRINNNDNVNNNIIFNDGSLRNAHELTQNGEMSQQEYLIARAFAHDDVDDDFVEQKNAQVNLIMKPEDVNSNLPGWGEWGGTDPLLNKRHNEKRAHVAAQKEIERSFLLKSRADAKLSHVIINHDGVELVPDRMTLHMIPRPFSNPTEFARSLRQPTGPEWTSSMTFKEMVQPRVEVRKGQAIDPLDLSLHTRKQKTKRRKNTKSNVESNESITFLKQKFE